MSNDEEGTTGYTSKSAPAATWLYNCTKILLDYDGLPLPTVILALKKVVHKHLSGRTFPSVDVAKAADVILVGLAHTEWKTTIYLLNCLCVDITDKHDVGADYYEFENTVMEPLCLSLRGAMHDILTSTSYTWEPCHRLRMIDVDFVFATFQILGYVILMHESIPTEALFHALSYIASKERVPFQGLFVDMVDGYEKHNPVPSIVAIVNRYKTEIVAEMMNTIYPTMLDGTSYLHEVAKKTPSTYMKLQQYDATWRNEHNGEGLLPVQRALLSTVPRGDQSSINQTFRIIKSDVTNVFHI